MFKGIIAIAENRVIGNNGKLPWPRKMSDLKFFKEKTSGGNLIFGRKTFDGLGATWLPSRNLFVLTHFNPYGWTVSEKNGDVTKIISSPDDLPKGQDYWVCGGKGVYDQFMPRIDEFYVTYIKGSFDGDVNMDEFERNFYNKELVMDTEYYFVMRFWN